jgi:cAMP phosphodiesterase
MFAESLFPLIAIGYKIRTGKTGGEAKKSSFFLFPDGDRHRYFARNLNMLAVVKAY